MVNDNWKKLAGAHNNGVEFQKLLLLPAMLAVREVHHY
jgi:hypothetical protein